MIQNQKSFYDRMAEQGDEDACGSGLGMGVVQLAWSLMLKVHALGVAQLVLFLATRGYYHWYPDWKALVVSLPEAQNVAGVDSAYS